MKRLTNAVILLLGLSMITMMTSCNKENDVSSYKDKIVGEWQMTKKANYKYDPMGAIVHEYEHYIPFEDEMAGVWVFTSEGTVKAPNIKKSNTDYVIMSYLIEENTLYIGEEAFTIRELTNSKMVWEQENSYSNGSKRVERYEFKRGTGFAGYAINTDTNPYEGGTVTGNGFYQQGETCTLNAIANNGYTFLKWTENGITVSADANYTFTVSSDRHLYAIFDGGNSALSISVADGYGFINDGDTVFIDNFGYLLFGFVVSSNASTLSSLHILIDNAEYDYVEFDGWTSSYTYTRVLELTMEEDLFEHDITAIVTDGVGRTNSASIHFYIKEYPLYVTDFDRFRQGGHQESGLEEYGLYWHGSYKDINAHIKPLDGVTLYSFNSSAWDATITNNELETLFANDGQIINEYNTFPYGTMAHTMT